VFRSLKFQGFNLGVCQVSVVFPIIIQAPRFFARTISLGDVQQTASAFGQVHDALSFFRNAYDQFARYRAMLDRLTGLLDLNEAARRLPRITIEDHTGAVTVRELTVRRPNGDVLVDNLELTLGVGATLLITGRSGNGKTTLLRSLADLWPYAHGTLGRPIGPRTMFLAQRPYLPLGTLRTALAYPEPSQSLEDTRVREVLHAVALGDLEERLDEENTTWWSILSPGEQQRLGFGRLLLARPDVVFLDEATAALDEGLEHDLYTLVRHELPNTVLVSVGHRSSLNIFHHTRLSLQGQGRWNLTPIATTS
jgi:putative ATP-binding cassette transporter